MGNIVVQICFICYLLKEHRRLAKRKEMYEIMRLSNTTTIFTPELMGLTDIML
ncbi:hypothetical protein LQZ18_14040 [Lachnospiraceae bacterium ZAX-1]